MTTTMPVTIPRPGSTPESYGGVGALEVRLARDADEIRAAQRLRYEVFYEELSARPSPAARALRRDEDAYDAICDHLVVVDRGVRDGPAAVVGTYRVLRGEVALRRGVPLYSAGEFDLGPLSRLDGGRLRLMEVGRSCVRAPYRSRSTLELLWHGLWTYARRHEADVMLGCASFDGTDPAPHRDALAYLHLHHLAPPPWRCRALPAVAARLELDGTTAATPRTILRALPPLVKGYLRLGAWIGEGAVIDRQFGTTDVLVILPVERIDPRYFVRFGAPSESESRIARNSSTVPD